MKFHKMDIVQTLNYIQKALMKKRHLIINYLMYMNTMDFIYYTAMPNDSSMNSSGGGFTGGSSGGGF